MFVVLTQGPQLLRRLRQDVVAGASLGVTEEAGGHAPGGGGWGRGGIPHSQ